MPSPSESAPGEAERTESCRGQAPRLGRKRRHKTSPALGLATVSPALSKGYTRREPRPLPCRSWRRVARQIPGLPAGGREREAEREGERERQIFRGTSSRLNLIAVDDMRARDMKPIKGFCTRLGRVTYPPHTHAHAHPPGACRDRGTCVCMLACARASAHAWGALLPTSATRLAAEVHTSPRTRHTHAGNLKSGGGGSSGQYLVFCIFATKRPADSVSRARLGLPANLRLRLRLCPQTSPDLLLSSPYSVLSSDAQSNRGKKVDRDKDRLAALARAGARAYTHTYIPHDEAQHTHTNSGDNEQDSKTRDVSLAKF